MMHLYQHLQANPGAVTSISSIEELEGNLPLLLLNALKDPIDSREGIAARIRGNGLERALEYIDQHAQEAITVLELCAASALTWRTLERAFHNHFGVSPKAYLKSIRLTGVH